MKAVEFCYWLQGYFEIDENSDEARSLGLTRKQVATIRQHLALVFAHDIDPKAGPPAHQEKLDAIHDMPHDPIGGDGPFGIKYRC
jgi:hypothetical protein